MYTTATTSQDENHHNNNTDKDLQDFDRDNDQHHNKLHNFTIT